MFDAKFDTNDQPSATASIDDQDKVDEIVGRGPSGALALAATATAAVLLMWLGFYFFVFLPRN